MATEKFNVNLVFLLFILLIFWMIFPYLAAIGWAIIAAIVVYPLFSKLHALLKWRRHYIALLTTILFLLIIIIPLALVIIIGIDEAHVVLTQINLHSFKNAITSLLNHIPFVGHYLYEKMQHMDWDSVIAKARRAKWAQVLPLVRQISSSLPTFLISIVLFCALLHTFLVSTQTLQHALKRQFLKALP